MPALLPAVGHCCWWGMLVLCSITESVHQTLLYPMGHRAAGAGALVSLLGVALLLML